MDHTWMRVKGIIRRACFSGFAEILWTWMLAGKLVGEREDPFECEFFLFNPSSAFLPFSLPPAVGEFQADPDRNHRQEAVFQEGVDRFLPGDPLGSQGFPDLVPEPDGGEFIISRPDPGAKEQRQEQHRKTGQ